MALSRIARRQRIHYRIRKHVSGTAERPRLAVFRSNKQIYCQVIDDEAGKTLAAASFLCIIVTILDVFITRVGVLVGVGGGIIGAHDVGWCTAWGLPHCL